MEGEGQWQGRNEERRGWGEMGKEEEGEEQGEEGEGGGGKN